MISRYKALPMSQRVTIFATFILLFVKITELFWPPLIFGKTLENLDPLLQWFYITFSFVSLFALIIINKENLQDLFVDRIFIVICILVGVLYAMYYSGTFFWIIPGAAVIILIEFLRRGKLKFTQSSTFMFWLAMFLALIPVPIIFLIMSNTVLSQSVPFDSSFALRRLTADLWAIIYGGMIFWGLLPNALSKLGMKNSKIFVVQLLLFWIYQVKYLVPLWSMFAPLLLGAWLGILSWHSKSLSPGTIGYFLFTMVLEFTSNFRR